MIFSSLMETCLAVPGALFLWQFGWPSHFRTVRNGQEPTGGLGQLLGLQFNPPLPLHR